jgi:hypothetical protein
MLSTDYLAKLPKRALMLCATAAISLATLPMYPAGAQSTDRDQPTPITSDQIEGTLLQGSDYFYVFPTVPGQLIIRFDLKPSTGSVATSTLQLYGEAGNELLNVPLIPIANSPSGDRKEVTVSIPTAQRVVMRLTDSTGYGGLYRVRLGGTARSFKATTPATGTIVKIPTMGVLRVQLKNGTTHEFDLRSVNQVIIQTQ